jgi:hypothetical protein
VDKLILVCKAKNQTKITMVSRIENCRVFQQTSPSPSSKIKFKCFKNGLTLRANSLSPRAPTLCHINN